jgi:hypothetical protein
VAKNNKFIVSSCFVCERKTSPINLDSLNDSNARISATSAIAQINEFLNELLSSRKSSRYVMNSTVERRAALLSTIVPGFVDAAV